VSGRIAGFGSGVSKPFSVGDKVVALLAGGGYAQQVAVPAEQVLRVPDGVDLVTAASLPEVAATVYSNLIMTAQLQPGETVLIHGATGGIGTMAIQLAKAFGAKVATTAGTEEKVSTAKAFLGADIAINYRDEDFPESLRRQNDGKGADVILDVVGAKYLQQNVDALADYGRLIVIGLQGGTKGELDLGVLLKKRAAVVATALRARPVAEKGAIMTAVRDAVWPLVADGRIRPLVAKTFPLDQVAAAHHYFDSGDHVGKVLLVM
jgi:NADPH2:quinone reductase